MVSSGHSPYLGGMGSLCLPPDRPFPPWSWSVTSGVLSGLSVLVTWSRGLGLRSSGLCFLSSHGQELLLAPGGLRGTRSDTVTGGSSPLSHALLQFQKFLSKVEEAFQCICCQELVFRPITTVCQHNVCKVWGRLRAGAGGGVQTTLSSSCPPPWDLKPRWSSACPSSRS